MSFSDTWKTAKKKFETDTANEGKKLKKPTEMWGPFRKGTGIESALEKLDAALAKKDGDKAKEAFDTFKTAADKYLTFLATGKKDKKYEGFEKHIQKLADSLDDIITEARTQAKGSSMAKELGQALRTQGIAKKVEEGQKAETEKGYEDLKAKVKKLTLATVYADAKLKAKFEEAATKGFFKNEIDFYLLTSRPGALSSKMKEGIYNRFIIGSEEVNIDGSIKDPLVNLAAQGDAGFKAMDFSAANKMVKGTIDGDRIPKFRSSVEADLKDEKKREEWRNLLYKL